MKGYELLRSTARAVSAAYLIGLDGSNWRNVDVDWSLPSVTRAGERYTIANVPPGVIEYARYNRRQAIRIAAAALDAAIDASTGRLTVEHQGVVTTRLAIHRPSDRDVCHQPAPPRPGEYALIRVGE